LKQHYGIRHIWSTMFFKLFALSTMLFVSQSGYDEANTFVASIFGIVPMTG